MLGSEDRAILEFEQSWWTLPGPKDQEIEFVLGLPSAKYYERLRTLVFEPAAMEHDPLTVKRVLTIIESRPDCEVAV